MSLAAAMAAAFPAVTVPARAVGADAALDVGGVGVAHVEAVGGQAEGLAQDLGEHGLEARAPSTRRRCRR